jgi:hypothetical protein
LKFQEHFKQYRIVVYGGLNCEYIVFDGKMEYEKRINLFYDDVTHHYHVINSVTGALLDSISVKVVTKGVKVG